MGSKRQENNLNHRSTTGLDKQQPEHGEGTGPQPSPPRGGASTSPSPSSVSNPSEGQRGGVNQWQHHTTRQVSDCNKHSRANSAQRGRPSGGEKAAQLHSSPGGAEREGRLGRLGQVLGTCWLGQQLRAEMQKCLQETQSTLGKERVHKEQCVYFSERPGLPRVSRQFPEHSESNPPVLKAHPPCPPTE